MRQRLFSHVTSWSDHMTAGLGALSGRSSREKESCTDVPEGRQRSYNSVTGKEQHYERSPYKRGF